MSNHETITLLVTLFGLLVYVMASKEPPADRAKEVGKIVFFSGLLAFLMWFVGVR